MLPQGPQWPCHGGGLSTNLVGMARKNGTAIESQAGLQGHEIQEHDNVAGHDHTTKRQKARAIWSKGTAQP
eukprot:8056839-Karenia_brevis.AAC.1